MKKIIIKNQALERLRSFSPWIYQSEIQTLPPNIEKGEVIQVYGPSGHLVGTGYVNPESQITVRILSFDDGEINLEFFQRKIQEAVQRRESCFRHTNAYRIIHAEADEMPGLVADYYDGHLSLQLNTAGMEKLRPLIISALGECIHPRGIYEKSDAGSRKKEGLSTEDGVLFGEIPERVLIEENGVKFNVHMKAGQKTGFYLDQRKNRATVASCVEEGFQVLDVFSNAGGFGIYAARKGARSVKLIDISSAALDQAKENTRLNHLGNVHFARADAFEFLNGECDTRNRYDLIILDPPSFTTTRHGRNDAMRGFRRLVLSSLRLLERQGYLALFSCSHHVSLEDLKKVALEAAVEAASKIEILEYLFQDRDHPQILNIPNSLYLKGMLLRKSV
jgi:23S rRNA (cytosine1962-C5)-methyltransferase